MPLDGQTKTPDRHLPLEGVRNFRDLGGYRGHGGRSVAWGRLFRSGRLSGLTDGDRRRVGALGLDLVLDFRQRSECALEPSAWAPGTAPRTENLEIVPGSLDGFFDPDGNARTASFMEALYRVLALEHAEVYRAMFGHILDVPGARVLLHCAAGKDRTGFGSALLLLALGVAREDVMEDYLLTSRFLDVDAEMDTVLAVAPHLLKPPMTREGVRPMFEVRRSYLESALDAMGDVDAYLEGRLGLGPAARGELRERYLGA
ncbi:tyrosine-protein phosphatase [Mesoterricola silvestris]|uniref:Protein-tyrosine-phosphatase n=1 Tax=Mesoterricola silvestris TaxID=2927979 RepID=A0AA48KBV2_9BACT|nr:tyrosine-protein phosphatase [Mesoterricola silvestris]BDU72878.1 protein-tyrosine-phosphatase [Mesoterricola silvestris]